MTLSGLGETCGPNPCTFGDYFNFTGVVSPACLDWQQTCSAEALAIAGQEQAIGQQVQQSVETSAIGTIQNLFTSTDPTTGNTSVNWMMIGLLAGAGFLAFKAFK